MSQFDELKTLLDIEEKLRVQAGFSHLKRLVREALQAFESAGAANELLPVSIFPADSGVEETDTAAPPISTEEL